MVADYGSVVNNSVIGLALKDLPVLKLSIAPRTASLDARDDYLEELETLVTGYSVLHAASCLR